MAVAALSPADRGAAEYLRRHRVPELLGAAAERCARERPDEPLQWLARSLARVGQPCEGPSRAARWLQAAGVTTCVGRAVAALAAAQPRPADPCQWIADFVAAEARAPPTQGESLGAPGRRLSVTIEQGPPHCTTSSGHSRRTPDSPRAVTWALAAPDYAMGDGPDSLLDAVDDEEDQLSDAADGDVHVVSKVQMVDEMLEKLRAHMLASAWGEPGEAIEDWLTAHRHELRAQQPEDAEDRTATGDGTPEEGVQAAGSGSDDDEEKGGNVPEGAGAGLCQVLQILRDTIAGRAEGNAVVVELQANNADKGDTGRGMQNFVAQMMAIEADFRRSGVNVSFQGFPVRKRRDDYREITSEMHVLMLAQMRVVKPRAAQSEEQAFEVFVNLVGHLHYKAERKRGFDHFDVIPSFGQLVNVQQPQQHKALCSPDAVVRCRRLVEALHHFKLALVRVTEHIIQSVIQGEFLHDVARRLSLVGGEALFCPESEEKRRASIAAGAVGRRRHSVALPGTLMPAGPPSKDWSRRRSAPTVHLRKHRRRSQQSQASQVSDPPPEGGRG
eukprot:TRINITY_DN17328_c0_g1_i1.p1 TRINITY_DN17328_c0_g1~~TRINITY_DN17328_c0_g1_i1.p1  ORF type:complete len:557 (+),score=121.01 TRINITY_DN17328_c0_g1_i1:118-1788(+)